MVLCKDQEIVQFKELVLAEATIAVPVMKEIVVSENLLHKNGASNLKFSNLVELESLV